MKNILTLFLLLICGVCFGQNLVPNPSFEDTIRCPFGSGHLLDAMGWFTLCGSTDYFSACANDYAPINGVPVNFAGNRYAYDGNSYVGLVTFYEPDTLFIPSYREHAGIQLAQPLTIGTKYYASVYISRADTLFENDTLKCASNNFGFRFSLTPTIQCEADNRAQIHSDSVITDKVNWTRIAGSFIADSAYQYVIIGNLFDNEHTISQCYGYEYQVAYYYVDMVCVSTDSLNCNSPLGVKTIRQDNNISLFPNPFSNQLTLSLADNVQTTISLYDFLGQQVLQQTFTNSTAINTEQIPDGIYLYALKNSKGIIKSGKVVKQ